MQVNSKDIGAIGVLQNRGSSSFPKEEEEDDDDDDDDDQEYWDWAREKGIRLFL